jgi:hypothetical protein
MRRSLRFAFAIVATLLLAALCSAPASAARGGQHWKVVRYGPFTLPAGTFHEEHGHVHSSHLTRRLSNVEKPCKSCHITALVPLFRYANGAEANFHTNAMLHHAVWSNTGSADLTCRTRRQRFFASGNERTPISLPRGYGYRVRETDRWNLLVELMNLQVEPQTVYVDLLVRYRKGGRRIQGVTPTWLDIDGCGDSQYSIPAGRSARTRDYRAPFDGKVVAGGGHVHDDGLFVEALNATRGKTICRSIAGYGTKPSYEGHIESMTTCQGNPVATFQAGDLIRLRSVYDSPEPQDDVMGIMLGYVVRTG